MCMESPEIGRSFEFCQRGKVLASWVSYKFYGFIGIIYDGLLRDMSKKDMSNRSTEYAVMPCELFGVLLE